MTLEEWKEETLNKIEDATTDIEVETYNKEDTKLSNDDKLELNAMLSEALSSLEEIRCYIYDTIEEFEENE